MRLIAALSLFAVPCVCAAAPVDVTEDVKVQIAAVQAENLTPEFARREFDDGVCAWNSGDYLAARNHWVRAQAWLARTLPPASTAKESLRNLVRLSDARSQPVLVNNPELDVESVPEHSQRRPKRSAKKASGAADARAVMSRARAAQAAGEIEKAAQLMRIASQMPGGESAGAEADALESALAQPAR